MHRAQPLIITVALTGNVPTKEMNANLPVSPEEIAASAIRCYKAGARVAHIHVRDPETHKPTQDLREYRKVVRILKREVPELIIQLTTGGRCGKNPQLRRDVVRLCPEMASFTTGSNNLAKIIYENSPEFILKLAKTFHNCDVKPEIECFDTAHIDNAVFLVERKKLLTYPLQFNFVLGAVGAGSGSVHTLQHMVKKIPHKSTWTATGVGWSQFPLASAAVAMGGHVRVGLEDMIFMPDKSPATNVAMVEKVVRIAKELGRKIATPKEAREILSLNPLKKDRILKYLDDDEPIHPVNYEKLLGTQKFAKKKGFQDVEIEKWNSWNWQVENAIRDVDELKRITGMDDTSKENLEKALGGKELFIPPRLLSTKI